MYPAAKGNYFEMFITIIVFGIITLATMLTVVMLSVYGLNKLPLKRLERFSHALAGATIFFSGLAILVLDL
jgi:sulfite exporter TauE/SafE